MPEQFVRAVQHGGIDRDVPKDYFSALESILVVVVVVVAVAVVAEACAAAAAAAAVIVVVVVVGVVVIRVVAITVAVAFVGVLATAAPDAFSQFRGDGGRVKKQSVDVQFLDGVSVIPPPVAAAAAVVVVVDDVVVAYGAVAGDRKSHAVTKRSNRVVVSGSKIWY